MNVLLVTDLYPHFPGQSRREVSYALHDFVRQWVASPDTSVIVAMPSKRIRIRERQLNFCPIRKEIIDGIRVIKVPLWNIPGYRYISTKPIERYLREQNFAPDIVVAHMSIGAEVAALLNKNLRKPSVFALHQGDFLFPEQTRQFLSSFTTFVFRSTQVKRRFEEHFFIPQNSFVASSGIDATEILDKSDYLSRKFHRPLRILSVNSLIPLKNGDVVIRALSLLGKGLDWTYTVVGDGVEREKLESLTNQLGLRSRVSFLGEKPRSECLQIMQSSDVFVMVSSPETFGLVYLEALAKGMIVIGCKGTGIDGIIRHGENGLLCNAREHQELGALLLRLVKEGEPANIRASAHETIRSNTLEKRASGYLQFLREVSETSSAPASTASARA